MKKLGLGGGLALLWKEGVDVRVINGSDKYILAKVVEEVFMVDLKRLRSQILWRC